MQSRFTQKYWVPLVIAVVAVGSSASLVHAGGGPENVFLLIDPSSAESKYVGNYYKNARNIPDRNVIYLPAAPSGMNYATFTADHLPAFLGMLQQRGVSDHIDYVVIPPGGTYRMSAPGYVSDICFPVSNFSTSSIYTMAAISATILDGNTETAANHYYSLDDLALAFDSNTEWWFGEPSDFVSAQSYFIGAMLGYSGLRGNTVAETLDMIDRSVAADGTHPAGTFYFMETADELRSDPRDGEFLGVINDMEDLGATAIELQDWLPDGETDCLGVLTGFATVDIDGSDIGILPGAFCDHLTSFAGYFDEGSQTKMSEWIRIGASGTCGAVEEPCSHPGKFPHPNIHKYYFEGLSLGEANLRSLQYLPFQILMYGDPLTRPFAYLPEVDVPDAPTGPVSGVIELTPTAATDHPSAEVGGFDVLADGLKVASGTVGSPVQVNTTLWSDGPHDLRVVVYEDSDIASQGRWIGTLETNNHGRSATASVLPTNGDLDTLFTVSVSASPADLLEIRLRHHGRVIAATQNASDDFLIYGQTLGAGLNQLLAEAEFLDGTLAQSDVVVIDVVNATSGITSPRGVTPAVAYDYHFDVLFNEPLLIDLPGTNPDAPDMTFTVVGHPTQSTVVAGSGPNRIIKPDALAQGTDTMTFLINSGSNISNLGTITIRYKACLAPAILTQPTDQIACESGPASFSVDAPAAVAYQWYFNDAVINGADEAEFSINPAGFDDVGDYRVEVTSACGNTVSSETVTLTLEGNFPLITAQPTNSTQPLGGTAVFVSSATGYFPPTFQWQKDGVDISGATSTFLLVSGIDCADAGQYRMAATNQCGTAYSQEATLTVTGCAAAPLLLSATSSVVHGSLGEIGLTLPLAGIVGETRIGGGSKLVFVFDQSMDKAVAENEANISVSGVNTGTIVSASMLATLTVGTTLTLEFPGLEADVLPSGDLFTVNLANLKSVGGVSLGGDVDVQIRILHGDTNGDQSVDPLDSGGVLARLGQDVVTQFLYDINVDGSIDPLDAGAVLARFGNSAP